MRCGLEGPDHLARVGVARDDGGAPLVVAGSLLAVPRTRVRCAVIHEVELGVIRQPAPDSGAALLPGVGGPARGALVGARVGLAVERLESLADLDVGVGPDVVRAPQLLAGRGIDGSDPAAHAHLATAGTDDDFSLHDQWRHGHGFALGEVAHLRAPEQCACHDIDGDGVSVEQVVEDLSVGVCGAAIHHVAAGEANGGLRVFRPHLPLERLAFSREVECVGNIGIRRDDVHRVADDQWLAFVAAKHAGGKCPRGVQVLHVGWRDLGEIAEARRRVVTRRHVPFASGARVWCGDARAGYGRGHGARGIRCRRGIATAADGEQCGNGQAGAAHGSSALGKGDHLHEPRGHGGSRALPIVSVAEPGSPATRRTATGRRASPSCPCSGSGW